MATISSQSKVAYMYDQDTDAWYAIGANVNTAGNYVWTGTNSFNNSVVLSDVVNAKAGVNNFQNPTARDAAIASPSNGIVCFVRQENSGTVINQVQYYYNGSWRYVNDSADLLTKIDNYTLQVSDAGKTIKMDSSSDKTITIPTNTNAQFVIGQKIELVRYGSGNLTIASEAGVTINSKNSNKKIAAQYSGAALVKTDTNTWLLIGDLTA